MRKKLIIQRFTETVTRWSGSGTPDFFTRSHNLIAVLLGNVAYMHVCMCTYCTMRYVMSYLVTYHYRHLLAIWRTAEPTTASAFPSPEDPALKCPEDAG